ncbi:hypothetical protein MFUL124B02_12000 [Myxococcus fulvus 124B02]|nr:hypothetical protein MFUL124B02_12000 [Myxococcus fulvus 124B02]
MCRSRCGRYFAFSRISRTFSTPLLEAPSISATSTLVPAAISVHARHSPQGVAVGPFSQLRALASRRAAVVLPTPRGPQNRYACATRSILMAFAMVRTTCSCPVMSSNFCGRHLRARTR